MRFLSKREIKILKSKLTKFDEEFLKEIGKEILIKELDNLKIYISKKHEIPILFEKDNKIFPTLNIILKLGYCPIPWVKVDEGAEKKIIEGANVFRPGIIDFSDFEINDPICVLNIKDFPIAIGYSVVSSKDLENMSKGIVVKVVHTLNDKIYLLK